MFYFVLPSLGCKIPCLSNDDELYYLKNWNYFKRKYNIVSDTIITLQRSNVMRKPVFRVCDQVRLKPASSATEASWSLAISYIATTGTILSKQQTIKVLIRLRGCAGWSAPLLFTYGIRQVFSWWGLKSYQLTWSYHFNDTTVTSYDIYFTSYN